MVIRKYERYDSYFIGGVVRHHINESGELHEAIQSLPYRFEETSDGVDAKELVARLDSIG